MIKSLFEEFVKYYYVYSKDYIDKNDIEECFKKFINECIKNDINENIENLINNFLPFDLKGEIDVALLYRMLSLDYINDLIDNNFSDEKVKTILCIEIEDNTINNIKEDNTINNICKEFVIKANEKPIIKIKIFNELYVNNKIKDFLSKNCKKNKYKILVLKYWKMNEKNLKFLKDLFNKYNKNNKGQ